jgi:serine phosphatase RsbU (regulator of sigma subunit)
LGFVVGDVTDKGVPAALVMAATRSVLRASAQRLVDPGAVLERVNEHLCPDMPPKMFVTCLYGVLEPTTGRFRFANAGHDLPYVKTAEGSVELRARGMPLGLMPGMGYEEKETVLVPVTRCCCIPTVSSKRTARLATCSVFRDSSRPWRPTPAGQS